MKYLIAAVALAMAVTACQKDDDEPAPTTPPVVTPPPPPLPECETGNFGFLSVTNSTAQGYYFYVNNVYQELIIPNYTLDSFHVAVGNDYEFKVVRIDAGQQYTATGDVMECEDYFWTFP